jgi:hypothetical protein
VCTGKARRWICQCKKPDPDQAKKNQKMEKQEKYRKKSEDKRADK